MSREDKVLVQIVKTMRGIWLCPSSHVYIFEVKIKTSIAVRWLMFKGRSHYVNIKYFDIFIISQLIWKFKKCGKVISLLSFSECSYGPRHFLPHKLVFYPEKSTQNGLKIHFKTRLLLIDHSLAEPRHCLFLAPLGAYHFTQLTISECSLIFCSLPHFMSWNNGGWNCLSIYFTQPVTSFARFWKAHND